MKTGPGYILLLALPALLWGVNAWADGEVHPTPWSVDFVGQGATTLDGAPAPVHAEVSAYTPTGVLAGSREVASSGWYLVAVYGDDPQTPLVEGAHAGERIAFTINGYAAFPLGPDASIWTAPGNRVNVNLRASSLPRDFDGDCRVTVADLLLQDRSLGAIPGVQGYYPPFDGNADNRINAVDLRQTATAWHLACH